MVNVNQTNIAFDYIDSGIKGEPSTRGDGEISLQEWLGAIFSKEIDKDQSKTLNSSEFYNAAIALGLEGDEVNNVWNSLASVNPETGVMEISYKAVVDVFLAARLVGHGMDRASFVNFIKGDTKLVQDLNVLFDAYNSMAVAYLNDKTKDNEEELGKHLYGVKGDNGLESNYNIDNVLKYIINLYDQSLRKGLSLTDDYGSQLEAAINIINSKIDTLDTYYGSYINDPDNAKFKASFDNFKEKFNNLKSSIS